MGGQTMRGLTSEQADGAAPVPTKLSLHTDSGTLGNKQSESHLLRYIATYSITPSIAKKGPIFIFCLSFQLDIYFFPGDLPSSKFRVLQYNVKLSS